MRAFEKDARAGGPAARFTRGVVQGALTALIAVTSFQASAQSNPIIDPAAARAAARAAGIDALGTVPLPAVENLADFVKAGDAARIAAVRLGKALFWDMQVGSDGQACASCHFHAGADSRARNQLSPGLRNVSAALQGIFDPTRTSAGGPDYTLVPDDFPFHVLRNPEENNFNRRGKAVFDTNDVASSQGVFPARFTGVTPGWSADQGTPFVDPIFNLLTPTAKRIADNVRRVEPRNTPTMINAVFNHSNFWDGRAHNLFNGASVIGPLDPAAKVWVATGSAALAQRAVRIPNSSLASQAVGPPTSDLEMAFFDKPFPQVGRKLLSLTPLGLQRVHPQDGVLGPISRAHQGRLGLDVSYAALIQAAFRPEYWDSTALTPDGHSLLEANFALFFGLAVQLYETTLVSDRAPLDRFMLGDDSALSQEQLRGLLVFVNRGVQDGASRNPPEVDAVIASLAARGVPIGAGNCSSCHGGPELTDAALTSLAGEGELELIELEETPELKGGLLQVSDREALLDNGFSNIGVRPTGEDLGRGGMEGGFPLSFTRQALDPSLTFLLPEGAELPCEAGVSCPARVQVDGAFKVPGLRNVELTGPYFHNGGQATLAQVLEFYDRQSDFADVNLPDVDRNMAFIDLDDTDEGPLLEFLLSLTDPRVREEKAPFDHPQLAIPNGGTFAAPAPAIFVPAVGTGGRPAEGLPPLQTFLGLPPGD